ncbi:hypothetical protein TEA_020520 [Camellia sinensis var. sinensis]|uniref:adenine phosphoribosyltransferase n=1 Tax=Camellia sinensis var. sinensis TaxID=542762 RepID=A0A4S4EWV8_CAMSN|nr:hypothetical protein TEA_020520 [Camellia sinensis var. sinensis]
MSVYIGIMFQDITTLLLDPKAFKDTIDMFVERYKAKNISVVAGYERLRAFAVACAPIQFGWMVGGIEARGFIFGPPIALAIGAKFVPLRKPRKLPVNSNYGYLDPLTYDDGGFDEGEVISEKYILEYGTDCLEMHIGAVEPDERALVVDDLIATGGTLCAAMNLLERETALIAIATPERRKVSDRDAGEEWKKGFKSRRRRGEEGFHRDGFHSTARKQRRRERERGGDPVHNAGNLAGNRHSPLSQRE